MSPALDFRTMPKLRGMGVSKRSGNHKAYRWVRVMQAPCEVEHRDGYYSYPKHRGWTVLGKYDYSGPIMSSIYHHHTALARHIDGTVALRWRCQAVECDFVVAVLT